MIERKVCIIVDRGSIDLGSCFNVIKQARIVSENELGTQLRRGGSLRIPRTRTEDRRTLVVDSASSLRVPRDKRLSSSSPLTNSSSSSSEVNGRNGGCERPVRPARRSASTLDQPAPEYLARNLLQLGCPVISMPT